MTGIPVCRTGEQRCRGALFAVPFHPRLETDPAHRAYADRGGFPVEDQEHPQHVAVCGACRAVLVGCARRGCERAFDGLLPWLDRLARVAATEGRRRGLMVEYDEAVQAARLKGRDMLMTSERLDPSVTLTDKDPSPLIYVAMRHALIDHRRQERARTKNEVPVSPMEDPQVPGIGSLFDLSRFADPAPSPGDLVDMRALVARVLELLDQLRAELALTGPDADHALIDEWITAMLNDETITQRDLARRVLARTTGPMSQATASRRIKDWRERILEELSLDDDPGSITAGQGVG